MDEQLTPWFPPNVKPVRPGPYIASANDVPNEDAFRYWDGNLWRGFAFGRPDDYMRTGIPSVYQDLIQWRGLAKEPK